MIGIYKITNILNNKVYIGQSINIESRIKDHFEKNYSDEKHIHGILDKEIRAIGKDNFIWEILIECSKEELNDYEKYFIQEYNSTDLNYGYNLKGGSSSTGNNQEKKVINTKTLEIYNSTEECAKQLNISQGDLTRVCNHLHGTIHGEYYMYLDEYQKNGIIKYEPIVNKGRAKKVKCLETNTIFDSAHEAGRQLDLNFRLISAVCNGKRNTTGGYHFIYL